MLIAVEGQVTTKKKVFTLKITRMSKLVYIKLVITSYFKILIDLYLKNVKLWLT